MGWKMSDLVTPEMIEKTLWEEKHGGAMFWVIGDPNTAIYRLVQAAFSIGDDPVESGIKYAKAHPHIYRDNYNLGKAVGAIVSAARNAQKDAKVRRWQIWSAPYSLQESEGRLYPAEFLGVYVGDTFHDACRDYAQTYRFYYRGSALAFCDDGTVAVYGTTLHPSEEEAVQYHYDYYNKERPRDDTA